MMELARRIGIDVPKTALVPVEQIANLPKGLDAVGERAFTIKRFGRKADGQRVHIEDFAQVFGVYPERKYERAKSGTLDIHVTVRDAIDRHLPAIPQWA